jgi:hypothetical protein
MNDGLFPPIAPVFASTRKDAPDHLTALQNDPNAEATRARVRAAVLTSDDSGYLKIGNLTPKKKEERPIFEGSVKKAGVFHGGVPHRPI